MSSPTSQQGGKAQVEAATAAVATASMSTVEYMELRHKLWKSIKGESAGVATGRERPAAHRQATAVGAAAEEEVAATVKSAMTAAGPLADAINLRRIIGEIAEDRLGQPQNQSPAAAEESAPESSPKAGRGNGDRFGRLVRWGEEEHQAVVNQRLAMAATLTGGLSADGLIRPEDMTRILIESFGTAADGSPSAATENLLRRRSQQRFRSLAVHTRVPNLSKLREYFDALHPSKRHLGVDDRTEAETAAKNNSKRSAAGRWLASHKSAVARLLYEGVSSEAAIAEVCLSGVPAQNRKDAWARILGIPLVEVVGAAKGRLVYMLQLEDRPAVTPTAGGLSRSASPISMDALAKTGGPASPCQGQNALRNAIRGDVAGSVGNCDRMFVFMDTAMAASELCLAAQEQKFAVEASVLKSPTDRRRHFDPANIAAGHVGTEGAALGILSFISMVPDEVALLHRRMHDVLWKHLRGPGSVKVLLTLGSIFEDLLGLWCPAVAFHLHHRVPKVPPLRLAVPWMLNGFATVLAPQQVLLLWDRLLGYATLGNIPAAGDSPGALLLLPIVAAALIAFRQEAVLRCNTADEVEKAFGALDAVPVVALVQHFLFVV